MTGILAVIKLREAGISDITVLEKKDKIGGTWRENTYPGVACDVPSHMYTYSFEPKADWTTFFAGGEEIQYYFEHVAQKYDVYPYIQFNEAVTNSHYQNGRWLIETISGKRLESDFVIFATGVLHHPKFPDIPGLKDFKGNMFHTAQWDHKCPMNASQRIGVIGTGSSAAQAIPEVINTGAQVSIFQRTPQWVMPIGNFHFPEKIKHWASTSKCWQKVLRAIPKFMLEHLFTKAVTGHFFQKKLLEFLCEINLKLSIKDLILRQKLTPDYQVGCKRVIINTTFYKGIQKANANLITDKIQKIVPEGVITDDGKLHPLDTLILSTGFHPREYMRPVNLTGKNDTDINDVWQQKVQAYRSLLIPEFPNMFLMLGPNTPIGNFSVIAMSEVQMNYILHLIKAWQNRQFDIIEVAQDTTQKFQAYAAKGLKNTAWVGGCQSWYLDQNGEASLWPYTWQRWVDEMQEPYWPDLILSSYS